MYYETEVIIYSEDGGIESIDWDSDSTASTFTVTEWVNFSGFGVEDIEDEFDQLEINIRFWKDRTDKDDYIDPVLETSAVIGRDGMLHDEDAEELNRDAEKRAKKQSQNGGIVAAAVSRLRSKTTLELLMAEAGFSGSVLEFPGSVVCFFSAYDWGTQRNVWLWACYRRESDVLSAPLTLSRTCDRPFSCSGEAAADYIARFNK